MSVNQHSVLLFRCLNHEKGSKLEFWIIFYIKLCLIKEELLLAARELDPGHGG